MADTSSNHLPVSPGRPRLSVDPVLLQELAGLGWGYKRIAAEYSRRTGVYLRMSPYIQILAINCV